MNTGKVLIISPMYPSASEPSFGVFIKVMEDNIVDASEIVFIHAVKKRRNKTLIGKLLSYLMWIIRVLWTGLTNKYDIIHAHTVYPSGILAVVLSSIRRKPFMITSHGSDICMVNRRNGISRAFMRYSLNRAQTIQAVSRFIKQRIEEFAPSCSNKIFVQCMGVNTSVFRPAAIKYRYHDKLEMVYVANLVKMKGWEIAFDIVRQLKRNNIKSVLHVFGDGEDRIKATQWINEHDLADDIIMHGAKSQKNIAEAFRSADLFLFPSMFDEAFSLVTGEALACGLPVIVAAKGALPELVDGLDQAEAIKDVECIEAYVDGCKRMVSVLSDMSGKFRESLLDNRYSLDYAAERIMNKYMELKLPGIEEYK